MQVHKHEERIIHNEIFVIYYYDIIILCDAYQMPKSLSIPKMRCKASSTSFQNETIPLNRMHPSSSPFRPFQNTNSCRGRQGLCEKERRCQTANAGTQNGQISHFATGKRRFTVNELVSIVLIRNISRPTKIMTIKIEQYD
jgi:hypothetical protein